MKKRLLSCYMEEYKECRDTARHFSRSAMQVRVLAITVVLTLIGLSFEFGLPLLFVSLFLLTYCLYFDAVMLTYVHSSSYRALIIEEKIHELTESSEVFKLQAILNEYGEKIWAAPIEKILPKLKSGEFDFKMTVLLRLRYYIWLYLLIISVFLIQSYALITHFLFN